MTFVPQAPANKWTSSLPSGVHAVSIMLLNSVGVVCGLCLRTQTHTHTHTDAGQPVAEPRGRKHQDAQTRWCCERIIQVRLRHTHIHTHKYAHTYTQTYKDLLCTQCTHTRTRTHTHSHKHIHTYITVQQKRLHV